MTTLLPYVEINPQTAPCSSVIWLHGLGADGYDFVNIVPELQLPKELPVRFIFPHAPKRPITLNGGYIMRAWYDIESLNIQQREDSDGVRKSQQEICALIENEKQLGIDSNKIILAGFSQGGAMALYTGLRYPEPLGGILALSAYLPLANTFPEEVSTANQTIPIMLAHGTMDPLVPIDIGEMTKKHLEKAGYNVEWHTYQMQHQVCQEEINDLAMWLKNRF